MSRIVVFLGSPRANGVTNRIVHNVLTDIDPTEISFVESHKIYLNISACTDCRYCWEHPECIIKDEMQNIYNLIDNASVIIVATPVYFHGVTSQLKTIIDRLQVYWASRKRNTYDPTPFRKGFYILTGGAPKFDSQFTGCIDTINGMFNEINTELVSGVEFSNTDYDSFEDNNDFIRELLKINNILKEC